jgi:tRNA(Ile)-lysidine synthase
LPSGIKAVKSYNNFMLVYEPINETDYDIEISEYVNLPNGRNIQKLKKTTITDNIVIRLSSDDIVLPLHVRTRKNGDKIYLKGMMGSKKVKDIFIDSKVPMDLRDSWPIVVDSNNTIVWIPDLKKSKFDRQKGEKCDIILRYY